MIRRPTISVRIGTWNAGGLLNKDQELKKIVKNEDLDFVFICETWASFGSSFPDDAIIYWSPFKQDTKPKGHAPYGVALLMGERIKRKDVKIIPGIDGLSVWWTYQDLLIGGVYLPPESSMSSRECTELLKKPESAADMDKCILVGDFNMRLGPLTGDAITSTRGNDLFEWFNNRGYVLCNDDSGTPTFIRYGVNSGTSIVDLIWSTLGTATHSFTRVVAEDDIGGSDHRLVYTEVLLSVDTSEATDVDCPSKVCFRLNKLQDSNTRKDFMQEMEFIFAKKYSEYEVYQESLEHLSPEEKLEIIEKITLDITQTAEAVAENVLGRREKSPRHITGLLKDQAVRQAKRRRRKAFRRLQVSRYDEEAWSEYKEARQEQTLATIAAKERLFHEFADRFEKLGDPERSALIAAMVRKKYRGKNVLLSGDAQSMETYARHFQEQFSRRGCHVEEVSPREPQLIGVELGITAFEIQGLMRKLPSCKAPGPSGFRNELLINGSLSMAKCIHLLFQLIWRSGKIPRGWTSASLIPVPKKGDLTNIKNYRPISLTEGLRKLYEKVVMRQLAAVIGNLDIAQGGFREKRSTLDQIASLNELIQQRRKSTGKYPIVAYLDIQAAYDTVDRKKLWQELENKGVEHELLRTLMELFDYNQSKVLVQGSLSRSIDQPMGLLQGSILSPLLYATFINELPKRLREVGAPSLGRQKVNSFFYADDIALVADDSQEMSRLLKICEEFSVEYNFRFNPTKCEVVGHREEDQINLTLYGNELKLSNCFVYLGMNMTKEGLDNLAHLKRLVSKATDCANMLRTVGYNGWGFGIKTKRRIYETFIRPILEYGLSLIKPTVENMKLLERAQHAALAVMFSVSTNTSYSKLRVLAGVIAMKQRWEELNAKWTMRTSLMNDEFMVHHALKASNQHLVKASCFNNAFKNENLKKYRDETVWKGRVPRDQKEILQILRKIRDETRSRDIKDATINMELISKNFMETAKRLDSFVTRGARRLATLFVLNKLFGKPEGCRRCGVGTTTSKHARDCFGSGPWDLWNGGNNYEAVATIAMMIEVMKGFRLKNWSTLLERERNITSSGGLDCSGLPESGHPEV